MVRTNMSYVPTRRIKRSFELLAELWNFEIILNWRSWHPIIKSLVVCIMYRMAMISFRLWRKLVKMKFILFSFETAKPVLFTYAIKNS